MSDGDSEVMNVVDIAIELGQRLCCDGDDGRNMVS